MEISWDTATRTADSNVRVAGTIRIIRDGKWEYRRNEAKPRGSWWAKHLETGEILRTGVQTMPEVRQFMYDLHCARGGNQGWTVGSGPRRAKTGHQRHTKTHLAA